MEKKYIIKHYIIYVFTSVLKIFVLLKFIEILN